MCVCGWVYGLVCMKLVYCSHDHILQEYCLVINWTEEYSTSSLTYCCSLNEIAQCTRVHIQYRDLSLCTPTMDDCVCVFQIHHTTHVVRVFMDYIHAVYCTCGCKMCIGKIVIVVLLLLSCTTDSCMLTYLL